MDNPYDLHSWSRQYREDALHEARTRHLVEQAKGNHSARFRLRDVVSAVSGALSVLSW
jgi:hypothetical protein